MTNYLIVRHGSNSANQTLCQRAAICWVEAKSQKEAVRIATEEVGVTCYNNQVLEAIPQSRVSKSDARQVQEDEAFGHGPGL